MATERERPYSQFNYLVDLGTGDTDSPQAGFQEVSGLGVEVTATDYRNGNEKQNLPRKITTLQKITDVVLSRGVIGTEDLYEWLKEVRDGSQDALRQVTIQLLAEDRSTVAVTWRLTNARPIKYEGPSLNGKGNEIAIEKLTLACENIDFE